jgi:hypothetical protein
MTDNYVMLDFAKERLQFWQRELQSAFRDANEERAVACDQIIAEYALLIRKVMQHLHTSVDEQSSE